MNKPETDHEAINQAPDAPEMLSSAASEPGHKRKKSWGEKVFDWVTYGGFAMGGNEAIALGLGHAAEKGFLRGMYSNFETFFTDLSRWKGTPKYITSGQLPRLLLAFVGGTLAVFPVKWMEDGKSGIVRFFDKFRPKDDRMSDAELEEAHRQMDKAPRQSWGSLWEGRGVTMLTALGLDVLVCWRDALTTKLFKENTLYQKFASVDRIAEQAAKGYLSASDWVATKVKGQPTQAFTKTAGGRALAADLVQRGTWLLGLSTMLTALFYVSSKFFAKKRDQRIERRQKQGLPARDEEDETIDAEMDENKSAKTTSTPAVEHAPAAKIEESKSAKSDAANDTPRMHVDAAQAMLEPRSDKSHHHGAEMVLGA